MKLFLIGDYEGPLDLILHMIKESKMEIENINVSDITSQYIEYIKEMQELNLDVASEYLVMASELIEMKSRSLLPKKEINEEELEENPEEMLKKRLLEYKKYKESTEKFKELENIRQDFYTKAPERYNEYTDKKINENSELTVLDLVEAFKNLLQRKNYEKPINTKITKKELSVNDRIVKIRNMFKTKKCINFEELFEILEKPYVIVTFLSILQMARDNEIIIKQDNNFSNIYLERAK